MSPAGQALRRAHAHNDYAHDRPFNDAVAHRFTSVEADVWLVDGELIVAHEEHEIVPGRTLDRLYLEPLAGVVGSAPVDPDEPWRLLIDLKSEGVATYLAVEAALLPYADLLTRFAPDPRPGAIEVVVSGDRPLATLLAHRPRHTGYDGRFGDLLNDGRTVIDPTARLDAAVMPMISDDWSRWFLWRGEGALPEAERRLLRTIVDGAHAAGQRIRFWNTPDTPGPARDAVWAELLDAGVDHLNSDDLAGLARFLREWAGER